MYGAIEAALHSRDWVRLEDPRHVVVRLSVSNFKEQVTLAIFFREQGHFQSSAPFHFDDTRCTVVYEAPLASLDGVRDMPVESDPSAFRRAPHLILGVVPASSGETPTRVRVDVDWIALPDDWIALPDPILPPLCYAVVPLCVGLYGFVCDSSARAAIAGFATTLVALRVFARLFGVLDMACARRRVRAEFPCRRSTWVLDVPSGVEGAPPLTPFLWSSTYMPFKNVCMYAAVRALPVDRKKRERMDQPRLLCAAAASSAPAHPWRTLKTPDGTVIRRVHVYQLSAQGRMELVPAHEDAAVVLPDLEALAQDCARRERAKAFRASALCAELMRRAWHPDRVRRDLGAIDT